MRVSVIICTCNRRRRLETTLASLERLEIPTGVSWELIVVDNNSTDGTDRVIAEFEQRHTLPMLRLFESGRGKSLALNTAIGHATGEIIAFTDDDCVVDPSWLRVLHREFDGDASLGGLGGRVELYDPADHKTGTRTNRQRQLYRPTERLALIFGCNMALSRRALRDAGEFDPWLGPGSRCRSGEDVDLLYRAHKRGVKVVYAPDLVVYHNHGRRTYRDIRAAARAYGVSTGALYCKHIMHGDRDIARVAYRDLRATVKRSLRVLLGQQPFRPNDIRPHDLMTGMMLYGSRQARCALGLSARPTPQGETSA